MTDRFRYDLTNNVHKVGHIGRLMTAQIIPVRAGESLSISLDAILRLAATRKEIVSECIWEAFGFFVPHRHLYGSDTWKDLLKEGVDAVNPLITINTGVAIDPLVASAPYLCINNTGLELPLHTVAGYNFIYQRYFAVPNTNTNGTDAQGGFENLDYFPAPGDADEENLRLYGKLCARLPHILNGATPVDNGTTADGDALDLEYDGADTLVPVVVSDFDIRDLADIQSRLRSETEKHLFGAFYHDLMDRKFGTKVTRDADQMPELLFHEQIAVSGHDVNGTDDARLGTFVGKTIGRVGFSMPRKAFNEHGQVWIMVLCRYPLIHCFEKHPITHGNGASFSYDELIAEAERVAAIAPIPFVPTKYIDNELAYTPTFDLREAFGQHYRWHPNSVHQRFADIPGYPFIKTPINDNPMQFYYHANEDYSDTFQDSQMEHWQLHGQMIIDKFTDLPGPLSSFFFKGQ